MVKHKRFSDKPKSDTIQKDEESKSVEQETNLEKKSSKITLQSITKYACLIAAALLLSGVFTIFSQGLEFERIIFAVLSLFSGLVGALLILRGINHEKFSSLIVAGGVGMMIVTLIIIYEVGERSIFLY